MSKLFSSRGFRTFCGIAIGGSALGFAVTDYVGRSNKDGTTPSILIPVNKVLASYTTNFEPTTKWDYNWDRRDPKSMVKPPKDDANSDDYANKIKKATPTACRHLFLIRHGQYNLSGKGDENRYLTKLGKLQAELVGKRLKDLDYNYDVLINSTMTRARETADIVAKQLGDKYPRSETDLLREGAPFPPEPPVGDWKPEAYFYEDGARIEAAFRKLLHRAEVSQEKDSHEVFICHANVIRYFICRALQLPPEAWLRISLHNCSITWLIIRPSGRVVLKGLGDAGYLSKEYMTFN